MRVVSLLASGTEMVCGVGAGGTLVGRSHECATRPCVRELPACTRPTFDITLSSREIDTEVRRRLKAREPLYEVDADIINSLKPDFVITQIHCDVCAVTPDDVTRAGCSVLTEQVVSLSASSVAEIYDGVRRVATALGRHSAGEELVANMRKRIDGVTAAVRGRP